MSAKLTTDWLVVDCRQVAEAKSVAMGNAGVPDRARQYANLTFEALTSTSFEAIDPAGEALDLVDMVLDEVRSKYPVEFNEHRHGGGKQTIYWHQV